MTLLVVKRDFSPRELQVSQTKYVLCGTPSFDCNLYTQF